MTPVFTLPCNNMAEGDLILEVFDDGITTIRKSKTANKTSMPYTSMSSIKFCEGTWAIQGSIQFFGVGGRGIMYQFKKEHNYIASQINEYINNKVHNRVKANDQICSHSIADEIHKLLKMKEQGILTEIEYCAAKSKVLGL